MEKSTVNIGNARVAYCRFGEGSRPLVILPGVSMTSTVAGGEGVAAAFASFTKDYTVFLFDRADPLPEGTTVEKMADDTAAAMAALGIARADVFGASQGAMMALCIALRHPELVRAMVLGSVSLRPNDVSRAVFAEWLARAAEGDVAGANRAVFRACYSEAFRKEHRGALDVLSRVGTAEDLRRFAVMSRAARDFDVYGAVSAVRCPVFAVGGEDDGVLTAAGTRELAEKLGCPSHLYPGGSHAVYDEEPDFRPRMLAFFRSVPC